MNNHTKNSLTGTKTEKNLRDAAANEALSHVRYSLFSDIAAETGHMDIARRFDEYAAHEKEHAELWLSYLDELGDTEENLNRAIQGENYETTEYYPELSRIAADEGFSELADKFRMTGKVEGRHMEDYAVLSEALSSGDMQSEGAETKWYCCNCGYHTMGNTAPDACPLCSYPKGYFIKK